MYSMAAALGLLGKLKAIPMMGGPSARPISAGSKG